MNTKDKSLFIFVLIGLLVVMIMGVSNIYANLMASGTVIFIEKPWLALALSALLPTGSAALKFVTNFMAFDRSRKRYAIGINMLTAIALLFWTILFAQNFAGITGEINWPLLDDGDSNGALFVWIQLIAELLVGASLFLVLEDIWSKYYTEKFVDNPEYIEANNAYLAHKKDHDALGEERGKTQGRLVQLEALKQALIDEKVARFISLRTKFGAFQNFNP